MKQKIAILGSTGSIGKSLLNLLKKKRNQYEIVLLTANKNYNDLLKQAKFFKVKNIIINDSVKYNEIKNNKIHYKINIYNNYDDFNKIFVKKIDYVMSSIIGLEGLLPSIKIIKHTKKIAIANKESIICAWNLLNKELKKYNTKFIPVDSEHFSIWSTIGNFDSINKVFLTASGGPFLNLSTNQLKKKTVNDALSHPTWKMGKKISIDSATLMNKVFEIIEAKKIFNLSYDQLDVIIHPSSYIHSIVKFKNGLIKICAHDPIMAIPIASSLEKTSYNIFEKNRIKFDILNSPNFLKVNKKKYPIIKLLDKLPKKDSLFETVLVTVNDYFVNLFLNKKIKYSDLVQLILKIISKPFFNKYKNITPKSINDILNLRSYVLKNIDKYI
jgi:1-deoxy-D-xylulose-5-phosphate reductoisomerase